MRFSICGLATDEMKSPGKRRKRDKNGDGRRRNEGRGSFKKKNKNKTLRPLPIYRLSWIILESMYMVDARKERKKKRGEVWIV